MIIITGSAIIAPEHLARALELGVEHSRRSRGEPGCITHNCHIDAEDPHRIVFVEEWADIAAVQAHFAVPDSGAFVRELSGMAVTAPNMAIYAANPIETRGL